jgi:hypothetical protein
MPHGRASSQKVEAFSAPRSLLAAVDALAKERRWTRSGFYRYCLALEVGYTREEAMQFVEHGGVQRALEAGTHALQDSPTPEPIEIPPTMTVENQADLLRKAAEIKRRRRGRKSP